MDPSAASAAPSSSPSDPPPPLRLLDSSPSPSSSSSSAPPPPPPPPPPSPSPRHPQLKCPRCGSRNTKFCYYNNYSLTQPRHFCKNCRRYWTLGGALRNVPVGGGCRKNKRSSSSSSATSFTTSSAAAAPALGSGFGFLNYDPSSVAAAAQLIRADPSSPMFRLDRYGSAAADTAGAAFLTRLTGSSSALFPHLAASAFISDPSPTPPYFSSSAAAGHYTNPHPPAAACHDSGRRSIQGNNLFELHAFNSSFQSVANPSAAAAITQLNNDKCHMQSDWLSLLQTSEQCGIMNNSGGGGGNMVVGMNLSDSALATGGANFIDIPDLIDTRFAATLPALRSLAEASEHGDDAMISDYSSLQQQAGSGSSCFVDVGGSNFFFHHLSSASATEALQPEIGGDRIMQQRNEAAPMEDCNSQTLSVRHVVDQEVFVEMGGGGAAEAINSRQFGPQIDGTRLHSESHHMHPRLEMNHDELHQQLLLNKIETAVKEEDGALEDAHDDDGHDGRIRRSGGPTSSLIMTGTDHLQHLHDEVPRELLISSFSDFSLLQPPPTGDQPWTQAQHHHDHQQQQVNDQQQSFWNVTEDVKEEDRSSERNGEAID